MQLRILDHEEEAAAAVLTGGTVGGQATLLVHVAEDDVGMRAIKRDTDLRMIEAAAEADVLVVPVTRQRDLNPAGIAKIAAPADDKTSRIGRGNARVLPP